MALIPQGNESQKWAPPVRATTVVDGIRKIEKGKAMIDCAWCPLPAADGNPLCPPCLAASAADIAALPGDRTALAAVAPEPGGPQQRVSGTRAPSVPIDLMADELARGIVWALGVWEPPVRELLGLPPVPEKVAPDVLTHRAATLLSCHVSDFAGMSARVGYVDGPERPSVARRGLYGVSRLRRLHQRAGFALDAGFPEIHLPGLCVLCGAAALAQPDGGGPVECRHCGHRVDADDYRTKLGLAGP
jgi:hypothetical protein